MNPLVSIIIPVYNSAQYIGDTLQSALHQTWSNKEIILIDDGSTDDSLSILRSFESPGVKVFHQNNKGASAARNYGLREAKGDYIQFLDSDDLLPPDKIEKQIQELIHNPDCIIGCRWVRFKYTADQTFGAVGPDISIRNNMESLKWLQIRHTMLLHAWLTPRILIEKAGWWNERMTYNDDGEFFFRVVAQAKRVLYTNDAIVYYRTENNNSISAFNSELKYLSSYIAAESYKNILYRFPDKSEKSQIAIGNYFMELIYLFYPAYPDLIQKCMLHPEIKMADIQFKAGGVLTRFSSLILGWKLTKRLRGLFDQY